MSYAIRKFNPTPGDVHVNRPLTNISIAFLQNGDNFVADRVFPFVPVAKQSDLYYVVDRGDFNRNEMKIRAPGTETAGGGFRLSTSPYLAYVYGYHHDIDDQRRANQDSPLSADREATELVTHKALIQREAAWASRYFTTSVWATDITGVSATPSGAQVLQWNDAASNPIEDVAAGIAAILRRTGFKPNTLVLGYDVFSALKNHPDMVDRIKYGQTGGGNSPAVLEPGSSSRTTKATMAAILDVDRILVSEAIVNTAAEGATASHSFITGKAALLCYSAPNPGIMVPSAGYTFGWTGYLGAEARGQRIRRFRMEHLSSDRIEIEAAYDQKLISADLGYFFTSIVA